MVGGTYSKMSGTFNTRSECLDKCIVDDDYVSVTYGVQNKKCYCDKLTDSQYGITYTSNSKYTSCYLTNLKDGTLMTSFVKRGTLNLCFQSVFITLWEPAYLQ